ncbi:MAG TPA: CmpA/NrtA family ABC transporter substrate-binding protein [Bauldia sp.]|nr:CmpA/NrtA family ABC transporter substrate-binding protein [Bauldia sp.]
MLVERLGDMERRVAARGTHQLTLGFMPLVDCAPLIVAAEMGFATAEGLTLDLVRETSWANIRDRVMLGHFHAAHMLGPLPIASTLGIGSQIEAPMVAPFSFGLGGNAVTVSLSLYNEMQAENAGGDGPAAVARAIAGVAERRRASGAPALTIAMVFPFSGHNYELRYWLASAGLDPDRDIRLVVLPPPFMVDALAEGHVDAFCVGEPWNSIAVDRGVGAIVVTKSALWRQGPEKVLGLRADFAERDPERLYALIRALYRAAAWAGDANNREALAELLARPAHVGASPATIRRALSGAIVAEPGGVPRSIADFLVFHDHAANFPWQSHALWFYSQMVRWGQTEYRADKADVARRVYRPDLYRAALKPTEADLPNASSKVEGALSRPTPVASRLGRMVLGPDGFFDGLPFDPDDLPGYLQRLQGR